MSAVPPRRLDPCPCGSGRRYKDCHGSLRSAAPRPAPPGFAEALALRGEGRCAEALALLDEHLAHGAPAALLLNLRGLVRQDAMDLDGALADFDAALALDPDLVEAHYNRGQVLLLHGDYERGWPEYAWRTRAPGYADYANFAFGMPRWRGEELAGRRILVHAEQGQGDTIQFARFLAPLARSGAAVDLFCHPPLVSLMARMEGVRAAMSELGERPAHDYHATIMDVGIAQLGERGAPHWFGPYVAPLPSRLERFAAMLNARARPLVGIAWKGSPRHANDRNRSLTPEQARALVAPAGSYVNLQLGEPALHPAMVDAARDIADWDDTVAVIAALDRVVCVDTAVAHVAGAMGKPVDVLLPFSPDWRWGAAGGQTPWYPTMRLLRQSRPGDWTVPIAQARRAPGP